MGAECRGGEEDHAGNEDEDEERREFAELLEQVPGEQGVLGHEGIVHERADEGDESQYQRRQGASCTPWIHVAPRVQPVQENGEAGGEQEDAYEVQLFEFLPSGLPVRARMAGRKVYKEGSDEAERTEAYTQVENNTPASIRCHGISEERRRDSPHSNVELRPCKANGPVFVW